MENVQAPFTMEIAEYTEWRERNRVNNFFELVYVLQGSGLQSVSHVQYPYRANNVFLLPAAECHMYIIEAPTRFLFIRFHSTYFQPQPGDAVDYSSWFGHLNFILAHHDRHPGEVVKTEGDQQQIKRLLDVVLYEHQHPHPGAAFIIQNALVAVLGIIARNLQQAAFPGRHITDEKFAAVLHFINTHILQADKTSIRHLAQHFHIAESYFGEYFKRNAGVALQDFLLQARLRIAASRATYTMTSFQSIAWELGFTDSSHLNRMLKKYAGKGMRAFRQEGDATA